VPREALAAPVELLVVVERHPRRVHQDVAALLEEVVEDVGALLRGARGGKGAVALHAAVAAAEPAAAAGSCRAARVVDLLRPRDELVRAARAGLLEHAPIGSVVVRGVNVGEQDRRKRERGERQTAHAHRGHAF
jgi:hypothetical protein